MNTNRLKYYILFFVSLHINIETCLCQKLVDKWSEFEALFKKGFINEAQYLDSIHQYAYTDISQGKFYNAKEFTRKLSLYEKIVWSNNQFKKYKFNYFMLLANNAKMQGKGGEAIYYSEKADAEYFKTHGIKSLIAFDLKLFFYGENENYAKVISTFKNEEKFIDSIPYLIKSGDIRFSDCCNYILMLSEIANAYIITRNDAGILKIIALTDEIKTNMENKFPDELPANKLIADFTVECIKYKYNLDFLKDNRMAYHFLTKMETITNNKNLLCAPDIEYLLKNNLADFKLDYYIKIKNIDSAKKYLEKFRTFENISNDQQYNMLKTDALIYAMTNHYTKAYTTLEKALDAKNKKVLSLTEEVDDLLYAYTDSEFNKEQLFKSEQEKQRRTIFFLITLLTFIIALFIAYFIYQKTKKRLNKAIDDANRNTNLKIATLENAKTAAINAEQEKIAQELHDNFSASLAGASHFLDSLIEENRNENTGIKLKDLKNQIHQLYLSSRNKSHKLFYESRLNLKDTFSASIISLIDTIFHNKYKKNVDIDADGLQSFSYDDKINVLRIIQEASINIIKHSKANEISIFLFKNTSSVILQISDNGVGFKKSVIDGGKEMGLGLMSILKRVELLNGYLNLSNDEGAVITITINR